MRDGQSALGQPGGAAVAALGGNTTAPTITVNGKSHTVKADPKTPLLYVLRDEIGLKGMHFGCGLAECAACTVQVAGKPIRSCVTPVNTVAGKKVTTLEGLGTAKHPHKLQTAFIKQQAAQCAYCIPGMIVEAEAFLRAHPKPSVKQIKTAMSGHLCRCGTYYRIIAAIQEASK